MKEREEIEQIETRAVYEDVSGSRNAADLKMEGSEVRNR